MWIFRTGYRRLAIIVPFEGSRENMGKFTAHLLSYFNFDKLDRHLPFSVHVIDGPMAKGTLFNIGFDLTRDRHYFCFHDPAHFPIWADYRYAVQPSSLIASDVFGGVLAFNRADFERVDGFGPDSMTDRCERAGLKLWKRNGHYQSLSAPEPASGHPLSLIRYQVLAKTPVKVSGTSRGEVWRYLVEDPARQSAHLNS